MTQNVPAIESARLTLRGWRDDDVEAYVQMNADARVAQFLRGPYTRERSEATAAQIRRELEQNGYGWWVVEIRGGTAFAGLIALEQVPFVAPFAPAYEIGWRLPFVSWGHGYATEGANAALRYAFDTLRWREVVAFTAQGNLRSRRVMERLKMTRDPADDFDHPKLDPGDPLRRHVLYRIKPS